MNVTNIVGPLILVPLLFVLGACASAPEGETPPVRAEYDPWEPMNRGIYRFNDGLDRWTLRPVARGYQAVLPSPVRRGVTNFSKNLFTPRSAVNNLLQGKPRESLDDLVRFIVNSTVGILGLVDVASLSGIPVYEEDFGQTFAVWGIPEGPFLVLPILGPQSLLDAVSIPLDLVSDPLWHYDNSSVRDKLYILRVVDLRARVLTVDKLLKDSKDPYITIRESYIQNRAFRIHDGDPPVDEDFYGDFFDDEETDGNQ